MFFEKTIVLKRHREFYHLSDVPKSEIFVYFTKNIAATWSVIKIIDISMRSAFYSLGYTAQSIHAASQKLLEVT